MTGSMAQSDAAAWSYAVGDQEYGPLTLAQLNDAAQRGLLAPHTAVRNSTTGVAQPAGSILGYAPPMPGYGPGPAPTKAGDDPVMRALIPVGRSGWAIAAGYLGLIGWLVWPLAPFALLTAELGRRSIAADPSKHGMGRVVTGYVGGVIGLVVAVLFLTSW